MFALICIACGCNRESGPTAQVSSQPATLTQESSARPDDVKDAYAVYDSLLGNSSGGAAVPHGSIAIADHTAIVKLCFDPATQLDPRLEAAGKNFLEQNIRERTIAADDLTLGRKVELISSTELDAIFSEGILQGWEKFRKSYPAVHGYVTLSAVGFNADKSFAVVYSAAHCGPNCGAGAFITLSKKDGFWRKNSDRLCSWIS